MTVWTFDIGNGPEDQTFDTFQEAFNAACDWVEESCRENYERGQSRSYTGRMDFDVVLMSGDTVVSRKPCWADINDNGFYKEKQNGSQR